MIAVDHDRLFKELLTEFFAEFLDLFLPDVSAYVQRGSLLFLDKEIFTDVTAGERHEADLVVRARMREGEAFFLVHVETQSTPQAEFSQRMFRYFARLHEKHNLPVYPIALFSYDAPLRPEPTRYRVAFPDTTVLDFRYRVIQLNRLPWRRFVKQPNPVASALMAKMHIRPEERPRVKLECLRLLATLRLNPARTQLISGFIDSYLRLNAQEQQIFDQRLQAVAPQEREATMNIVTSWMEDGIQQGLKQGRQEGLQQESQTIALRLLRRRFGPVSETLEARIRQLSQEQGEDLAEALLDFHALSDADDWLARRSME